jgi:hypothetical protein
MQELLPEQTTGPFPDRANKPEMHVVESGVEGLRQTDRIHDGQMQVVNGAITHLYTGIQEDAEGLKGSLNGLFGMGE